MNKRISTLLLASIVAGSLTSFAGEVLSNARSNLEQWIDARKIISEEKNQWLIDVESLTGSIAYLKTEIKTLNKEIESSEKEIGSADINQQNLKESIEVNEDALSLIAEAVPVFEKKLIELSSIFPIVFNDRIASQMRRIPTPGSQKAITASLEDRIQNVFSILENIEYFNNVVTLTSELRTLSTGEQQEVKTVYLGFGQAYFVDENETYAGWGYPVVGEGWVWTDDHKIASAVGQSVKALENRKQATFVTVPVLIK